MRVCTKCGEGKPLTEYRRCSVRTDGLDASCKACRERRRRERWAAAPKVKPEGDATCVQCGQTKPTGRFNLNGSSGTISKTCRACRKAKTRRRKGVQPKARRPHECPACTPKSWSSLRSNLTRWANTCAPPKYREAHRARLVAAKTEYARLKAMEKYRRDPQAERLRVRTYKHANPEKVMRWQGKRAALAALQSDGTLTRDIVARLFRESQACPYCGDPYTASTKTLDHVIPLSRGGVHGVANALVCCRRCNSRKRARSFPLWLDVLEPPHRARALQAYYRLKAAHPDQGELTLAA